MAELTRQHGIVGFDADDDGRCGANGMRAREGIEGSPHFFCGDMNVFCPSLEMAKDETGHLQIRRNVDRLNGFLSDCLAGSRGA